MRPARLDIAVPPLPPGIEWIGEPIESIEQLVAGRPALVHFFDFAQLNSIRVLPYLRAWHERYEGLAAVGVHSPRFPFTRASEAVAGAVDRLEIDWPVALDPEFTIWRSYEPHGWPALFLWGQGGALRWYHLGEGEYEATEEAIREALDAGSPGDWPPLIEPIRPSDAQGATVIAPTAEIFPGGMIEEPWSRSDGDPPLETAYEAGGAFAAVDGEGEIGIRVDGEECDPVAVSNPGLIELTRHVRTEGHRLELSPSPGVLVYSLQFAPAIPYDNGGTAG